MPAKSKSSDGRVLVIGAHPDDAEFKVGGIAALWSARGFVVRFVSATNGGTGHHAIGGIELVTRRVAEAAAAAKILGIESQILDIPNGELEPSLVYRRQFIHLIRDFKPDLILTHRPNDYHPDHRYCSQLVQDASYVVTVPNNLPTTPALRRPPVIMYLSDDFQKPISFKPDVVIGVDSAFKKKVDALHQHTSQIYEWLPWNRKQENEVPAGDKARRAWLEPQLAQRDSKCANQYRAKLIELYGQKKGSAFKYAEAFELCEYGAPLTPQLRQSLFPFATP